MLHRVDLRCAGRAVVQDAIVPVVVLECVGDVPQAEPLVLLCLVDDVANRIPGCVGGFEDCDACCDFSELLVAAVESFVPTGQLVGKL